MADDFTEFDDDFIVEDEEGTSNRPFILAVMGLVGVLLAALVVLGVYVTFFNNPTTPSGEEVVTATVDNPQAEEATQISATNEAVETENAFVTQTLESRRLTDEAPTATPTEIPATETPEPTATEEPEVVEAGTEGEQAEEANEGEEEADVEAGEEANVEATSIFSDVNTVTPSAEEVADTGSADDGDASDESTAESMAEESTGDSSVAVEVDDAQAVEQLPDTGFGVWGVILAAFALLFLFVGARRLRTE